MNKSLWFIMLIIFTNQKGGFEFLRLLYSATLHDRYKFVLLHFRIAQSVGLKPCSEGAACLLMDRGTAQDSEGQGEDEKPDASVLVAIKL